jgi:hypothetical protein
MFKKSLKPFLLQTMQMNMNRLLIVACSQRKRSDKGLLPAIERYDGPVFNMTRRYLRQQQEPSNTDILVLSAKYGLIDAQCLIPDYDQKLSPNIDNKFFEQVNVSLQEKFANNNYRSICIGMSQNYYKVLAPYNFSAYSPEIIQVIGGHGNLLSGLHKWLYNNTWETQANKPATQKIVFRGVIIQKTKEVLEEEAQKAILQVGSKHNNYKGWYTLINNKPVAIKWLVTLATGVKPGVFHSHEARRLLMDLGFKVERV